jgi:hypothetical protein
MTNPDRPLKAGPDPDYGVTKADLQAIQQRRIEAVDLHRRVDQAVLNDALANGPALARRLAGKG